MMNRFLYPSRLETYEEYISYILEEFIDVNEPYYSIEKMGRMSGEMAQMLNLTIPTAIETVYEFTELMFHDVPHEELMESFLRGYAQLNEPVHQN